MNSKEKKTRNYNTILHEYTGDIMHVDQVSEFITNRLYLMIINDETGQTTVQKFRDWKKELNDKDVFYLNVDELLVYKRFNFDFGPYNLGSIFRYIYVLRKKLSTYRRVVHCAHKKSKMQTSNAVFLVCAYLIIEENWTAEQAYSVCSQQNRHYYKSFRDATNSNKEVETISVLECLNALYKAKWFGFFDLSDFDLNAYEYYTDPTTGGDVAWILPDSLLAFPSPCSGDYVHRCNGKSACSHTRHPPEFYYQYFKDNGVRHIVRLNSKVKYNAKDTFVAVANIRHTNMSFPDGSPPSDQILETFLRLCEWYIDNDTKKEFEEEELVKEFGEYKENDELSVEAEGEEEEDTSEIDSNNDNIECIVPLNRGAVAVHCRAGLGRTGCLIASYIMKHWTFTANETIAWVRICRPGSIFGAQQRWLNVNENKFKLAGQLWRQKMKIPMDRYKCFQNGIYSIRRNRSVAINAFEYVDEPPDESFTSDDQMSIRSSFNEMEHAQSENFGQIELPATTLDLSLATNNRGPDWMNEQALDLSIKKSSYDDKDQSLESLLPSHTVCQSSSSADDVHMLQ